MSNKYRSLRKRTSLFVLMIFAAFLLLDSWVLATTSQTVSGVFDYSAAVSMFQQINAERQANGLPALGWDSDAAVFAAQRAAEVSVLNSHLRPDGSSFSYGENYSVGSGSVQGAMVGFMQSPAHAANILSAAYTAVGCAVFTTGGRDYYVQTFSFNAGGEPSGSGSQSESRTVIVADEAEPDVGPVDDKIQLTPGSYIMAGGRVNGVVSAASWSSSNSAVASVDNRGKISAMSPGYAVITADFGAAGSRRILVTVTGNSGSQAQSERPNAEAPQMTSSQAENGAAAGVEPAESADPHQLGFPERDLVLAKALIDKGGVRPLP